MCVKLLTNNFLSEKAIGKSKDVHLAVLRVLPEVIRESVDAEQHADYRKREGGKGSEGERRDAGRIVAVNQGKRDGSGVDADASSKSVIVYDPATGEKKMVSPTAVDGIESLGEVKTAEQREAEINAHMQDTIQRSKDWLEGNVANPVGMQIQLGDGRIATIEAMHEDGKSAIATLPDGTQFLVPKDVLQRIVNNGQYADYKARRDAEASKREAEQSTESAPETATEGGQPLPEEESREYAQGDVFDVVVDGQKMHAEIVSPKDADGRFVVNVDDGESMRTLYVTPEELAAMEYREEPSPKAEETRLATEDSSDKALERGAQPTEEHTPTALERIPRDEKGNAQFHDVDTETAWDGLVEMSGNEETAHKVAEASLANAERKLKAAKALKEEGETPEELLRSIKENEAAVAEAQRVVDAWKAIVGEKSRREEAAKAEAERIATEKAEAERKAAEERERAEAEEKTRIEAEKKEAERIAAEKAEEEARVEAERKAEEERKTKEEERKERDENGQPFVVSSDGTTTFGEITEDTGLTVAPIKLSEGVADEMGNGYGLRHIEARHGDQIRKAGFSSVEEFIEQVAKNYDVIKEGSDRNGNKTYRLLLTDKHNNTLMIELSKDGSYWNVNTAGVFKKSYGKDKKEVYNRHTTVKQSAETAETSQADEHSGTQSTSRMNVPTTSADKGSEISEEKQGKEQGKMDVVDVDNPQSWVGHTFTGIKGLFKGQQFVCEGLDGDKAVFHLKTADDDFKFSITKMRDMFARGWLRVENADLKRGNESVFDIAAAIAKKEGKEAAERQERMDGYTADMPPMRRARVRKTLGKELNYRNFGVMTEGEFVESMVAAGGIVTADFHNGKMRRLIDINDGELGHLKYPVSKAAADYAVYLGAKVNESELVNAKTEARMHEIRRKYADEDERGMFDNEEWLDREIGNSSRDKRKQERYEDLTEYKKLKEERDAKFNAHMKELEKKQKKQSVFDKAKEIADKEEKKRKAEAEDDSVLGQATRAVGKKKKVNLFKYTASEKISNLTLRGVHYANGYAYASDGYILFKEKADYPKEWEGTTRDKDGNLIDGKYPDAEKAIHRLVHIPDKEAVSLPSKEVLDFAIAASKKLKGEAIPVAIDGLFFNAVNLKKFLEAVASKGMDKIVYRHPMLYATNGKDEIVMMPTVNTLEGALDIADRMESAGLPKEQIDAWKAHIEAADKKMSLEDFKKAVENAKKEGVRPTEADKQECKAEAEKQKVDKQGNPIDAEGRLIIEKVEDISDLSDDDFNNPTRSVELPKIPKNVDDALGANGRPVIIKKNIFEKNGKSHGFTPKQSRKILGDALYNPDIVGQSQPSTKKTHWVAIKVDEKSPITILEVNDGKDNVEVVGWYTLDARNLERIKRQAEREGGELLVLSPKDKVESLPTPTSGLPTDKGSEVGGEKQEAEKKRPAPIAERIEDVGEKIGDARKDVWKEIIARIKNKKQGIEEALKKSSAGKLFSSLFDEKELLESGVSNEVVTFISAVKGSLGTKPRSLSKLKMWINKVLHQYDMCEQALENWESVKKKIDEWKYYSQPFYMYRAAMAVGGYESGRDVGNAELWQIADGYSDGKSVAGQWCVRKAGAYDGIYKTYEEAAEALKKFAGENAAVDGKGKRKEVKLVIYKRRTDGTMFIAPEGKPDVIIQDGFKTLYEASAYKKEHYAEMQERYRTLMDGIKPKFNENRERKGRDWRGGKDVSAEDFREAFDFRGVEFGNWMQQKDRRQALNECYDSLMDLAMVCGVSPKALSLGGKLAMAFGARGGGKFNAHYEPDKVVINLTKTKGAGSLAHEWFHAIDNYFNMQGWDEFATESTRNVERKEMAEAWKDLVRAINGSDYFKRSDKYARLKGSRYWIEPTELGARAFAVWVENRLSKYGTINDYLANNPRLVDEKASDAEKKYAPYPFDKDADWMDEKFGRLFEVMQERVDEETGKHILYSRNKVAGHEKTELTAEERELRDNLVERMRKGGLDVVTDSEEMQRVIDTENERTRESRKRRSAVAEERLRVGNTIDEAMAAATHLTKEEARAMRREWERKFKEETKELYGRVLSGNFDDVTLRLIDEFIDKSTPNNPYGRPLSKRLPPRVGQKMRGGERTGSIDALFSRISESAVGKDGKALPRAERERAIEEKKKELLKKWAIATGNWHTDIADFTDQREPIGSGTDSDVYLGKDGKSVIKVSKGKPYGKRFRPDVDNVALFNSVFRNSAYTIVGYGEVDGKFVRFLKQPIVDFTSSTPLTEGERVAYMEKLGFKPINKENTAFSNGEIIASDLQKSNIVKDKQGNVRVIDADMKLHTKDFGGKFSYPDAETDTRTDGVQRFLRTADGEVYGLVKDGRIYLDPKVATSETAVHEYTHLWGDMLRRKDSEQWSHTVKELKNSVLWEEVKELYPELKTDNEIADEVLSTFSGRRGAERLREEARRVAEGDGGVFTKAKAIETLERVKEAIARFWEGVARMFGINRYRSAEELADMAMRDLLDSKNPMKDESGMRKRGEVGDEGVKSLKGEEAMVALDNIFEDKKTENMPQKVSSLVKFMELFRKPVRTFLGEVVNVKEEVYNKIIREKRTSISGAVLPTLENADFAIRDTDGSTLYIKRFKSENNDNVYNIAVVNKYGEVEDYVSSVHIKSDNNLRNKITKGAELLLPQERITDGILPRNNPTPTANVTNISELSKPRYSRKPGESIFDYASRVSEDVDRSVRERVSARDEYEKKVKSKGFQTKEALQNSMLGLQEFMSAIDHASGNKRYIEDIPDFENPILGENRLSSVNKEEMHQVAKTQFKPLMSAVAKLSGNGKESGDLYDYMFAKHGLERDAVMRQREAQKEFDKYQKANPKGTKTIGDFVASLEGKDYAGLTALTAEDGRVKSIQSQIDAIDEQMKATDDQLLLRKLGGQKKRLKVDLLNAARDAADDIRKAFESNPSHDRSDINELWSRVNEVNGNTLRKLYESGMLTKEAYNDISSMYTNYIPMRGFDQTTSADAYAYLTHGDSAFNAPIKTAKGRSSKADNPIAYMQAMAESAIMQGNRNVLVKQKMLNFVRNHPSDLASVSDVWLQYDSVADEWKPVFPDNIGANDSASVVAKKMEAFEDKMKQMAEKHPDLVQRSNEAPDIPYKVVEKGQLNEHQVLVKQNGKSYIITVNGSPRAAQAANGLTNPDTDLTGAVGKVFEGAEALNRQLSSLYTTLNPDFIGSNYVRDALYSNTMVYVKEGAKYGGSFNLNFAKYNPAEMANLYARYNKGSLDTSNETHRLFLEFMQNGGETGFVNLKQIEKRKSEIAKAIKRDGEISAAQIWGGLNDAIDFANRAVENSARFAAYVTSRKSGRSVGRSVYDAKEISVNFNRKGSGRNWWKDNVGTSRFYDTEIGLVEINRASVGSSLAHRYSQVKLDVITSLAEGFNNAVYFGSMQDFSRQEGVKSHYFAYPINYNENRNYVFCRAMQDANKSRLYVHEVFLADNIEKGNTLQTAASQPHRGITLYKDILANVLAANVTNDSETSKPCFSRKPGESIFDYASRVSEDVDRSVCEGR